MFKKSVKPSSSDAPAKNSAMKNAEDVPTLSLETIIRKHLGFTTFVLIVLIMVFYVVLDISAEKDRTLATAEESFTQIESIMEANAEDKQKVEEDYNETSLMNARAVAYILENNPDAIKDTDELKKLPNFAKLKKFTYLTRQERLSIAQCQNTSATRLARACR